MNDQPVQPDPNQPSEPNIGPKNIFVTEEVPQSATPNFPPPVSTTVSPTMPDPTVGAPIVDSQMPMNSSFDVPPPPGGIPNTDTQPPMPPVSPSEPPTETVITPKKSNNLKPLLIIFGVLLIIGALVFAALKFIVPMLSGGKTSSNKEVTLTWWGLWEDQSVVAPVIAQYQTDHPNVKINYVKQTQQDYRERLTNALAKGAGPDIFTFHNSWVPMFKNDLDILPAKVMTPDEFTKTYYPVMASDLGLGNSYAGIPTEYDGLALFINEDLFATQGKSVPKTWDELRQTAKELTIKDNETNVIQQAGIAMGRTENVDHWQEILALLMLQNGVKMATPEGKNAEDALAFFTVFSTSDGIWDETLPPSTIAFSSGKAAMYLGPSWRVFEIKQQNPQLKFKVVPVPQLAKVNPTDPDASYATYWVNGVWKRSENRDAAWDFMKYLSGQDALQRFYSEAIKVRLFGQPYPRVDMASLVSSDPIVSAFVVQAPVAKSWYLQSRVYDGATGINSQINKYFEDAINAVNTGSQPEDVLSTVAKGVDQVLSNYGLSQTSASQ